MPKRVIDFDAMWASDKLAACAEWAQAEYAWLYGLADCAGCFELTNLRVIWGRVSAIRYNFSLERLEQVFNEFHERGLLFIWSENGKRYGHWTGSDVPGRLPPPSWRNRLERLAPPIPREQLETYVASYAARGNARARFSAGHTAVTIERHPAFESPASDEAGDGGHVHEQRGAGVWADERARPYVAPEKSRAGHALALKPSLEVAQAQDLGLDQEGNRERSTHTHDIERGTRVCESAENLFEEKKNLLPAETGEIEKCSESRVPESKTSPTPTILSEIWEQERGPLPELRALTPERLARCRDRIAHARDRMKFIADFREAVRRAAATPFLCGAGPAGWRANFDWIIANDTNYLKVLEGRYDAGVGAQEINGGMARAGGANSWAAYAAARDEAARRTAMVGTGPQADRARMRPEVVARILARKGYAV